MIYSRRKISQQREGKCQGRLRVAITGRKAQEALLRSLSKHLRREMEQFLLVHGDSGLQAERMGWTVPDGFKEQQGNQCISRRESERENDMMRLFLPRTLACQEPQGTRGLPTL